jgi:hypothetical protein
MQQLKHESSEKFNPAEIIVIENNFLLTNIKNYLKGANNYIESEMKRGRVSASA